MAATYTLEEIHAALESSCLTRLVQPLVIAVFIMHLTNYGERETVAEASPPEL